MGVKAQGTPGKDGLIPHIGTNGNWYVGYQDLGIKAQGAQGTPGRDGIAPHIGANGNWYVGDKDLGVKAQGATGMPGKDGSRIYAGKGAPDENKGSIEDWYIDTENKRLYGPKTAQGWGNSYLSLGQTNEAISPSLPIKKTDYDLTNNGKTLLRWNNTRMTHIDMNSNEELREVTHIEKDAFAGNRRVTSIILGDKVVAIGERAFSNCEYLVSVTLPQSLLYIGNSAFENCKSIIQLNLPNQLKSIGLEAFNGCEDLQTLTIPSSIEQSSFSITAVGITSIKLPKQITTVRLDGCKLLKEVELSDAITSLSLSRCSALEHIVIPKGVKKIERSSFTKCFALKTVVLHKDITQIEDNAFLDCRSLTTVTVEREIPPFLGDGAFNKTSLKNIFVPLSSEVLYKNKWSDYRQYIKGK